MYAVIESGGKQYRVELGSEIEVASVAAEPGESVEFERVLLVADGDETSIGRPVVGGARVSGSVVAHGRGEKVIVFKYQPKARRRVKHGHRQDHTVVRIADIVLGGRSAAKDAEARRADEERARADAERAAERQAKADRALAERLAKETAPETPAAKPSRRRASTKAADSDESTPATRTKAPNARGTKTADTAAPEKPARAAGGRSRKVQAPEPAPETPAAKPTRRRAKTDTETSKES